MPHLSYATCVLNNYCDSASVYYDRPSGQLTPGTGNTFVIADHNFDMVLIQGFKGNDVLCYTFPRDHLTDARKGDTVAINKYGLGGGCVLIGEDLHCYVSVQVKRGTANVTELWHLVIQDIIIR